MYITLIPLLLLTSYSYSDRATSRRNYYKKVKEQYILDNMHNMQLVKYYKYKLPKLEIKMVAKPSYNYKNIMCNVTSPVKTTTSATNSKLPIKLLNLHEDLTISTMYLYNITYTNVLYLFVGVLYFAFLYN